MVVGVHAGLVTLAFTVAPALMGFYAGMLLGHAILAVYVMCEHRGLPMEGSVLERTRSIKTNAVAKTHFMVTPFNANSFNIW